MEGVVGGAAVCAFSYVYQALAGSHAVRGDVSPRMVKGRPAHEYSVVRGMGCHGTGGGEAGDGEVFSVRETPTSVMLRIGGYYLSGDSGVYLRGQIAIPRAHFQYRGVRGDVGSGFFGVAKKA